MSINRILVSAAMVWCSQVVYAQQKESLKAERGNWNAEVNLNPFNANPISLDYIRLRRFGSDNQAFRLGFELNTLRTSTPTQGEDATSSTVEIGVYPGFYYALCR